MFWSSTETAKIGLSLPLKICWTGLPPLNLVKLLLLLQVPMIRAIAGWSGFFHDARPFF